MTLDAQLCDPGFRAAYLRDLVLTRYITRSDGCCAMGAVSLHAGGSRNTDVPSGVSVVLGTLVRTLNDHAEDGPRQDLLPFLLRLVGSADQDADHAREGKLLATIESIVLRAMWHRLPRPLVSRIRRARTRRQSANVWRAAARHLLHPVGMALHAEAAMALAVAAREEEPILAVLLSCQALGIELRCHPDAVWRPALALLDALITLGASRRKPEALAA